MEKIIIYIYILLAASGCGYNDFGSTTKEVGQPPLSTITIAELRKIYSGMPVSIDNKDMVFSGNVSTTDRDNNFYRSIIIDDGTGAIEILAGLYDLHSVYAISQKLTILPAGLVLGTRNGVLQLGLRSGDGYNDVGYISHRYILDKHIFRTNIYDKVAPIKIQISEIQESEIGRLILVEGAVLDEELRGGVWSGDIKFRTSLADSIYVSTSPYASFSKDIVPQGELNITGVLTSGKVAGRDVYKLKIRGLYDVEVD